ncbi:MBL fold metallo-hydrolase [Deinococcus aquiradiocola]|nr:MBL fold metallo-hydrolase [Deinococcus aquiradiocola]
MGLDLLTDGMYVLRGAVNSVVVTEGESALLVDTGLDESHARKLLRAVQEAGFTPRAVLNTHSHADHHGGNAFLLGRLPDLPVFAPPLEAAVIRHPLLEPLSLFGASPPRELRGKFLLAPASPAQEVLAGTRTLGGVTVDLLDVPGHAVQMLAVRRGAALYAADALFGPAALAKHPLTFCADSAAQKASVQALAALTGVAVSVPGHGEPTADLVALAGLNARHLERLTGVVLDAVQAGEASVDELLVRVCAALDVVMADAGAVVLNRGVVSAHLTELLAAGRVTLRVHGNRLLFGPAERTGA